MEGYGGAMGAVTKGNTPATEIVFDRVIAMLENEDDSAYPNDAVFVPADLPDFDEIMSETLLEDSPIIVVYSDGRERLVPAASTSPETA